MMIGGERKKVRSQERQLIIIKIRDNNSWIRQSFENKKVYTGQNNRIS